MGIFSSILTPIAKELAARISMDMQGDPRIKDMVEARSYRRGQHRPSLKPSREGHNDNVALNFIGLVVNRAVSQTIGGGIEYKFEGDDGEVESPQAEYIHAALDANKQEVLFHRSLLFSCEAGTGYWMLAPDAQADTKGNMFPRIVVLDPAFMSIKTKHGDFDIVESYTHEYIDIDPITQREVGYRKVFARNFESVEERWTITDYISRGGKWEEVAPPVLWPYPFSPVLHWQNAPSTDSIYGEPDITDDMVLLQDQINYDASNINKIIRLYAHPQRFSKGVIGKSIDIGPDQMPSVDKDGDIVQLEPVGDIAGPSNFLLILKKAFFDIARMVDIDSLDAQGALTNFGMKVRYQDNLNKIATKRELFGDAIEELCRRLMIMAGLDPVDVEVIWPDWMPVNEVEQITAAQQKIDMGITSKQTVAEELGLDWEQEQERMDGERQANDNVGATLLRAFNRGQENGVMPNQRHNQQPPPNEAEQII